VGRYVINMGEIRRSTREALLVAVIGCAIPIGLGTANAQTGGAVQYPPASVGEDAQPPPPAKMVPQTMSPRRIELGVSGPSERPRYAIRGVRPSTAPTPPPTLSGN
jgi:hypothetical protein